SCDYALASRLSVDKTTYSRQGKGLQAVQVGGKHVPLRCASWEQAVDGTSFYPHAGFPGACSLPFPQTSAWSYQQVHPHAARTGADTALFGGSAALLWITPPLLATMPAC